MKGALAEMMSLSLTSTPSLPFYVYLIIGAIPGGLIGLALGQLIIYIIERRKGRR